MHADVVLLLSWFTGMGLLVHREAAINGKKANKFSNRGLHVWPVQHFPPKLLKLF